MKERAKQIIVEIARQSPGDEITGKVRLFKAFYFAHLYYVSEAPDYLSEWPIVRMPMGPGIHDFHVLLDELKNEGRIEAIPTKEGPFPTTTFRFVGPPEDVGAAAVDAIRKAVEFISDKTASQLSEMTHQYSNTWQQSANGDELNIYADLLCEDEDDVLRRGVIDDTMKEVF